MAYVHTESLEKLLCSKCAKYLSHFPIYTDPIEGNTCGRCPSSENAIYNVIYEYAVEHQKFPCCYHSNGCLETLFPKYIPQHENLCSFRKHTCPMICSPACNWEGFTNDLLDHFEDKHPTFILGDGKFEIDFINSHKENYLLPFGENLYIVTRAADSKSQTYFCTVNYIGSNPNAESYLYKLILENGNKSKVHEITKNLQNTTEINGDIIRSILNDPMSIIAHLEIFQEEQIRADTKEENEDFASTINYELLRELECLVCMEYMVPPIHQCLTGHSICLKCKENVTKCPTCKQEFKNTQNFALAQVINHIIYPCKHDRCTFTAKAANIKQHEASCVFGPFDCPLKEYLNCDTKVIFTEIYDHILNNHYENILEMETVTIPFDIEFEEDIEDCYILRYGTKLFKLHYFCDGNDFYWAMQLIGPKEESKNYKFELDFIDNSGSNCRVYLKSKCSALSEKSEAFLYDKSHVSVEYKQIRSLITTELSFRVRIVQD